MSDKPLSEGTKKLYYERAFFDMKRCLSEAESTVPKHPYAEASIAMKHPSDPLKTERVMSLLHAIKWCVQFHVPQWSASTWRMHRCGYMMLLNANKQSNRITEDVYKEHFSLMYTKATPLKKSERVKKTSAKRKKNVSLEHIAMIDQYIKDNPNRVWGQALGVWMKASIVTGLRPNEWSTAEIIRDESRFLLRSKNFKYNEKRSYAEYRELDLSMLPDEWLHHVRQQIALVAYFKELGQLLDHYRGCSALLLDINKKLWPRRKMNVQLYTGRHQFSANAKASSTCSDKERAAMMGHKTTKTATINYGKGVHGGEGLTPTVADPSVLQKIHLEVNKKPTKPEQSVPSPGRNS